MTALQKPNVPCSASRLRIRKRANPFGARAVTGELHTKIQGKSYKFQIKPELESQCDELQPEKVQFRAKSRAKKECLMSQTSESPLQTSEGGSSNSERRSASVGCVAGCQCALRWALLGDQVDSGFPLTAEH